MTLVVQVSTYSIVEVDAAGQLTETVCVTEASAEGRAFAWMSLGPDEPGAISTALLVSIPDGRWVRRAAQSEQAVGWDPGLQPEDCEPGMEHASGCLCYPAASLPSDAADCRVVDTEGDGAPGVTAQMALAAPSTLSEQGSLELYFTLRGIEGWVLPADSSGPLVGELFGALEGAEIGRGPAADSRLAVLGETSNASCPAQYGHVQWVPFAGDCEELLAADDGALPRDFGMFDVTLDADAPAPAECQGPICPADAFDDCGGCLEP